MKRRLGTMLLVSTILTDASFANVVGADTQNFNPITSGVDFVTVHSSETLEPGVINFGFFLNHAVNTLPYFQDSPQGRTKYSDALLGADLHIGIGLLPGFDVGLSVPQVLMQQVDGGGFHGQFAQTGNTEVRINGKVRLYGDRAGGIAAIASANVNRIKDNPFTGKDAGPTYNLELAADTTVRSINLGLNLGRRWRQPGETIAAAAPIVPLGDQYIGSVAASYLFTSLDTKLIFEVFGSRPTSSEDEDSDRLESSTEALVGVKHDFTTQLAGHTGAGTELVHGRSSPDWRLYAGLNYTMGPEPKKPAPPPPAPAKVAPAPVKNDPFKGPPRAREKIIIHDILFEFDSDSLVLGSSDSTLQRLAAYLNEKPVFTRLIIEGHTDSIGSDKYNDNLSQRRAAKIRSWLISRYKLDPSKIIAAGKGERYPIADNGNYQGRQLNRRVEFMIFRNAK